MMNRNKFSKAHNFSVASVVCFLCFIGFSVPSMCQVKGFPFPDEIKDWKKSGEAHYFIGDELFELINGGAEVYHEYGFNRVDTMDYQRGEDLVSIEAYTMNSSAYGIFTSLTSEEDQRLKIGNGSTFSDYYLMMWQGNVLFAITAQFENDETESTLKCFAETFVKLVEPGSVPEMIGILPQENRIEGSDKYIVGHLGLQNIFDLGSKLLPGFEQGVSAKYQHENDQYIYIILRQKSEQTAIDGLKAAQDNAKEITGISSSLNESVLTIVRENGNNVFATTSGEYIKIILATSISEETIRKLLFDQ